jgi:NAD(P)H-flavin reductase
MGSITFQVIGDGSVGTKTKTFTVADADINRLVEWAKVAYRGDGPALNTTQALLAWTQAMMDDARKRVRHYEYRIAQESVSQPPVFDAT